VGVSFTGHAAWLSGDTHTLEPSWRGHCTCRGGGAVSWLAFASSGDHPFDAETGHHPAQNKRLLLTRRQMQAVPLLGGGSRCTLLAG